MKWSNASEVRTPVADWRRHGFASPESALKGKPGYFKRHSLEQLSLIRDLSLSRSLSISSAFFVCNQLVNHGFVDALQYIEGLQTIVEKPHQRQMLEKLVNRYHLVQSLISKSDLSTDGDLMTSLYEDEKYTFIRTPNGDRDLMVVFTTFYNHFGVSNAVLVSVLQQAGFSVLLLRDRSKYRYLKGLDNSSSDIVSVATLVKGIASGEKFDRVFVTGFSSGGYGSLFLSTLLEFELYLGFSIESDFSGGGPPARIAQQPEQLCGEVDADYLVCLSDRIRELKDGTPRVF